MSNPSTLKQLLSVPVIVAALGYFVDIYDLLLFGIVRVSSLRDLQVPSDQLLKQGIYLINSQMAGMLVGGILWGVLADKKGRISVLFGSIALYSLANIANGFVTNTDQYALMRFIAGVGLAGELGVGITLVAEVLPKEIRGYGTTIVASVGVLGAVLAYFIADLFQWRIAYFIGGGLGLALLVLRFNIFESGMFRHAKQEAVSRGNFFALFTSWKKFLKYLRCIMIGLPTWFIIGILFTFSPEFGEAVGLTETINAGKVIMLGYIGLSLGDMSSGLLSQFLKSRRKALIIFISLTTIGVVIFLLQRSQSATLFYGLCFFLGFAIGYWALFVTVAAEQFGTNLRATVATTVPNFVRGSVNLFTFLFMAGEPHVGFVGSGALVGGLAILLSFLAVWKMEETFSKNLDFTE